MIVLAYDNLVELNQSFHSESMFEKSFDFNVDGQPDYEPSLVLHHRNQAFDI